MRVRALSVILVAIPVCLAASQAKNTAPESFKANAQVAGGSGGAAAIVDITIDRYTSDADHAALTATFKKGDAAAFVQALKKAPAVGTVKIGTRSVDIHWARQQPQGERRRIVVVTGEPIAFLGAGAADAKPTEGFDVAVVEFTVDSVGLGSGSMAAAAKVQPGGATGVQIDDYSGKRMTLVTVTKTLK